MKQVARYAVHYGLAGCYLPDSTSGPYEFTTRRDFAAFIRNQIEFYELPRTSFADANLRRVWSFIKRHGSSSAHFTLYHKGNALCFYGLTEAEYSEMDCDQ